MARRLPAVRFERGLRLILKAPPHIQSVPVIHEHLVIGRLEDGPPFFLEYLQGGVTRWVCPSFLDSALRKKILAQLREEVRRQETPPSYMTVMDLSGDSEAEAYKVREDFHARVWRGEYLGGRDGDSQMLNKE